jgi:hypothetical protein
MNRENVTKEITDIKESLENVARSLFKLDNFINRFDLIDCLGLLEKRLIAIMTWGNPGLKLLCRVKSENIHFYGKRLESESANVYWDDVRRASSEEIFSVEKFFSFDPFEIYGEYVLVSDGTGLGLIKFEYLEFYLERNHSVVSSPKNGSDLK